MISKQRNQISFGRYNKSYVIPRRSSSSNIESTASNQFGKFWGVKQWYEHEREWLHKNVRIHGIEACVREHTHIHTREKWRKFGRKKVENYPSRRYLLNSNIKHGFKHSKISHIFVINHPFPISECVEDGKVIQHVPLLQQGRCERVTVRQDKIPTFRSQHFYYMLIRQSARYLLRYEVLETPYPSRTVLTNARIKECLVNEVERVF